MGKTAEIIRELQIPMRANTREDWTNIKTGERLSTVVITAAANPLMAKIHNSKDRMPFIFDKSEIDRWLEPGLKKDDY
jgi:putative SOS response-associated peptidase YedK